ncbi:MAG: hypothetical protein LBB15_01160, partial [Puniceicoccales bacterium]|nr:hypothetical protein [Puniceicoccales bacterium]
MGNKLLVQHQRTVDLLVHVNNANSNFGGISPQSSKEQPFHMKVVSPGQGVSRPKRMSEYDATTWGSLSDEQRIDSFEMSLEANRDIALANPDFQSRGDILREGTFCEIANNPQSQSMLKCLLQSTFNLPQGKGHKYFLMALNLSLMNLERLEEMTRPDSDLFNLSILKLRQECANAVAKFCSNNGKIDSERVRMLRDFFKKEKDV